MPFNLLNIPEKIRNEIYKYLVVQYEPICFELSSSWDDQTEVYPFKVRQDELEINIKILRVNKLIHREASFMLYSKNCFNFTNNPRYGYHFENFFDRIGMYANFIRHVKVQFPVFAEKKATSRGPRNVFLKHNSGPMFDQIQSLCTSLETIELTVDKNKWYPPGLESEDYSTFVAEGLALIDTRLRAFRSLQHIRVATNFRMSRSVQMEMGRLGWEIGHFVTRTIAPNNQTYAIDDTSPYLPPGFVTFCISFR